MHSSKNSSVPTLEIKNMRPCTDRRRRSGAQTSVTDVKRSRTGRRSVRVPRRILREGYYYPRVSPFAQTFSNPNKINKKMGIFIFPFHFCVPILLFGLQTGLQAKRCAETLLFSILSEMVNSSSPIFRIFYFTKQSFKNVNFQSSSIF